MPENNHEFQLLGILLQYPDQIDQAADELENRHFSNPQAGLIYEELLKQFRRDGGISRTKLLLKLREGNLVNDPEEIMERLTSGYNSREELKPTIDLIKEDYQKKLLRQAANQLQELASDPDRTIDQYQSRAQEIVFKATSEASDLEKHIFSMEEALIKSYEYYIDRRNNLTDTGVQTGYMSLDRMIGGFKKGHLNVIAASTSMGKTAFAINIAQNILRRDIPVGIISLEMEAQEIVDRMIVQEAMVNAWKYSQGETSESEDEKISSALNKMHEYPLMISDERGLNVAQIRARLRKFKSQLDELGLVIVDYLQMVKLPEDSAQNTARAVGEIVLQLRNMASELEVPIVLISQISRS
ncbi:MAG: replicative DNA helicase, partial [Halarsenatibacteraceae bacterium]